MHKDTYICIYKLDSNLLNFRIQSGLLQEVQYMFVGDPFEKISQVSGYIVFISYRTEMRTFN